MEASDERVDSRSLRNRPREQPDEQRADAGAGHGVGPREHDRRGRGAECALLAGGRAARLARLLDRLELVLEQIRVLEEARDAAVARDAGPGGEAEGLARRLAALKGIGPELATLLAWEAFVRPFRNRRALAAYAGLTGTPSDSGGKRREQGIAKAGNRRLRAALVELAWLWLRYQPESALAAWFRHRTQAAGGRMRKVMIVALARKPLVASWRLCREGVVPEGAALKAA
jgi:transposase